MTVSEAHEYDQPDGFKGCFTDVPGRVFDDYSMFNSEMTTEVSHQGGACGRKVMKRPALKSPINWLDVDDDNMMMTTMMIEHGT